MKGILYFPFSISWSSIHLIHGVTSTSGKHNEVSWSGLLNYMGRRVCEWGPNQGHYWPQLGFERDTLETPERPSTVQMLQMVKDDKQFLSAHTSNPIQCCVRGILPFPKTSPVSTKPSLSISDEFQYSPHDQPPGGEKNSTIPFISPSQIQRLSSETQ